MNTDFTEMEKGPIQHGSQINENAIKEKSQQDAEGIGYDKIWMNKDIFYYTKITIDYLNLFVCIYL